MLDTKQSWDALVMRHAPDEETAHRILDNRLYESLTERFVQSHDYVAMERLFEIHQTGKYDLIIVDTPPTRNALDFLDAPARMADFFGGRLLRWLTAPYRVGGKRGARIDHDGEQALLPRWPTASSAVSSSRTSPSSSSTSSRCTTASSSARVPSRRSCTTSAPRSWS